METQARIIKQRENDIHGYDKRLAQVYRLLEKDLSSENFELIKKYDQMFVRQSLAKAYRCRNLNALLTLTRMLNKNWTDVIKDDIDNLVYSVVQTYSDHKGKETNTTADAKKYLKMFFRWIKFGSKEFKDVGDPPETKDVRIRLVNDTLVRENLVEKSDYERIIHACHNSRDRAMFAVQDEAGTRPGELLSMKLKHVKFDDIGAVIAVDGKTGARPVRLIKCVPYLANWVNLDHPDKENLEAPLWPQLEGKNIGKPLNYFAARKALLKAVEKAKISKRITLNLFRHSEATETANFMTEAQLRKRHGWSKKSNMPARYVHLINQDVEDALLKHYGIKKDDIDIQQELPIKCVICEMLNPPKTSSCTKCGKPLSVEAAIEAEEKSTSKLEKMEQMILEIDSKRQQDQIIHDKKIKQLEKKISNSK
jgi:integrase/recombinase XerD